MSVRAGDRWRGVLFDKDGTLIDFDATWLPAYRAAAVALAHDAGRPDAAERLLAAAGYDGVGGRCDPGSLLACGSNPEIIEAWCAELDAPVPASARARAIEVMNAEAARSATPLLDVAEVFEGLAARGVALGVATMDDVAPARAMLSALGVLDRLAFVCGSDSGYGEKPGPGMVEGFCATLGVAAAEIAVVGDTPHDMRMGRAAGAGIVVGVASGAGGVDALAPHADVVIRDVGELEAVLFETDG